MIQLILLLISSSAFAFNEGDKVEYLGPEGKSSRCGTVTAVVKASNGGEKLTVVFEGTEETIQAPTDHFKIVTSETDALNQIPIKSDELSKSIQNGTHALDGCRDQTLHHEIEMKKLGNNSGAYKVKIRPSDLGNYLHNIETEYGLKSRPSDEDLMSQLEKHANFRKTDLSPDDVRGFLKERLAKSLHERLIDNDLFYRIQSVAENLRKRCPPETCVVIGIGGSPTPFIAYLQSDPIHNAFNVPLGLRGDSATVNLSAEDEMRLTEHLNKYFPDKHNLEGKSVLFFDFMSSGGTAKVMIPLLNQYLKSRGQTSKIEHVFMTSDSRVTTGMPTEVTQYMSAKLSSAWSRENAEKNDPLLYDLHSGWFKKYSEFESFQFFKSAKPFDGKSRKEYHELLEELRILRTQLNHPKNFYEMKTSVIPK